MTDSKCTYVVQKVLENKTGRMVGLYGIPSLYFLMCLFWIETKNVRRVTGQKQLITDTVMTLFCFGGLLTASIIECF